MRTRVSPGSKAQLSLASPARATSASARSIASPLGNENEANPSCAGARISRSVISAFTPNTPQSPQNSPARSGP